MAVQRQVQRRKQMRHVPSVRAEDKGAVPQTCGLRNGIFGRQGGVHLPQWCESRDEDLKTEVSGRFRSFPDIQPTVFAYGNIQRIEV